MLKNLIGNTPLIEIDYKYKGRNRKIYAKAEWYNVTGSIKDRMARNILLKAKENGSLKDGMPIIEATSGNAGIAFSAIGRLLGHDVIIYMPDWMSEERVKAMKSYGAKVILVTREQNGFLGSIEMADKYAEENNGFRPQQFSNELNSEAHYNTTGPEIERQLKAIGKTPAAFVAGVGTGGTVMGTGRYLKEAFSNVTVHPLEPASSPTLSTGHKVGMHRIAGISDDFIPEIINFDELDDIVSADDGDSIIMAQQLSKILGLGVGISSGANFLGAVELQNRLGDDAVVVTVFSDDQKKYLSTDLAKEEPVKDDFLTNDIELISMISHK